MKFVNFFASTEHYFCIAVDTSQSSCKFAHVDMPLNTGTEGWKFNNGAYIGRFGAHYQGKRYDTGSSISNALNRLNYLRNKKYDTVAQHFAEIYL